MISKSELSDKINELNKFYFCYNDLKYVNDERREYLDKSVQSLFNLIIILINEIQKLRENYFLELPDYDFYENRNNFFIKEELRISILNSETIEMYKTIKQMYSDLNANEKMFVNSHIKINDLKEEYALKCNQLELCKKKLEYIKDNMEDE